MTAAPKSLSPSEIRTMAAKQFAGVFNSTPYIIRGWDNLPDEPGHIFIYNHLLNHPYNTLPNHFQITLDSHFISSMVLYAKYGEAGIRVVRVPRAEEYGHEYYYERLGHINVYTDESDTAGQTPERKKAWREKFYETAGEHLKKGFNIVISPEGTSMTTEESPGPFRLGAFLLAASVSPEPYIVPVAVANFDKRINQNVFSLTIKKPFRVSERVENPGENKDRLFEFVREYGNAYRTYVEEAAALARRAESTKINLKTFEQVEKEFPAIDRNLFEQDVRILERRHVGKKKRRDGILRQLKFPPLEGHGEGFSRVQRRQPRFRRRQDRLLPALFRAAHKTKRRQIPGFLRGRQRYRGRMHPEAGAEFLSGFLPPLQRILSPHENNVRFHKAESGKVPFS